ARRPAPPPPAADPTPLPPPPRLRAARAGAPRAAREFLRLARLCPFARQDRARPREPRGARGAAAAVLAPHLEEPGERPQRALYRLARLWDRGDGAGGGAKAPRRADRRRDRAGAELRAFLAQGRRRDVGQPRDAPSRPALARARGAAHGAHHDLRDRGRRSRQRAPAVTAGGGVATPRGSSRYPPPIAGRMKTSAPGEMRVPSAARLP